MCRKYCHKHFSLYAWHQDCGGQHYLCSMETQKIYFFFQPKNFGSPLTCLPNFIMKSFISSITILPYSRCGASPYPIVTLKWRLFSLNSCSLGRNQWCPMYQCFTPCFNLRECASLIQTVHANSLIVQYYETRNWKYYFFMHNLFNSYFPQILYIGN